MRAQVNMFGITEFSEYKGVHGQYTDAFIKKCRCVKISETDEIVRVAVAEGSTCNIDILKEAHSPKGLDVIEVTEAEFAEFIGTFVDEGAVTEKKSKAEGRAFSLEDINTDAPVVNAINAICLEAIRKRASDIHIQGGRDSVNVRLRMDGVLQTVRQLDKSIFGTMVSRIKVMAGLNVMENRLCQDGRMSVVSGGTEVDFRVSVVPSVTGQNIVLRVFNSNTGSLSLSDLGFSAGNLEKMRAAIRLPYGMILATGPTGSGKTTTLHAMLKEMDREHLKIVTIEDPVEKEIEGVEQIQTNAEIGLTFESVLRRILRQDPDVIMVGEIRDRETAELAVRSALTGHLILSTIHTNDSVSAITRLRNLGIEPYLIAGVLRVSMAQRLVRKICTDCGGEGCDACNFTGYRGRSAVGEVFCIDDSVAEMIETHRTDSEIRKYILAHGFTDLRQDARNKISEHVSTEREMLREGLL